MLENCQQHSAVTSVKVTRLTGWRSLAGESDRKRKCFKGQEQLGLVPAPSPPISPALLTKSEQGRVDKPIVVCRDPAQEPGAECRKAGLNLRLSSPWASLASCWEEFQYGSSDTTILHQVLCSTECFHGAVIFLIPGGLPTRHREAAENVGALLFCPLQSSLNCPTQAEPGGCWLLGSSIRGA